MNMELRMKSFHELSLHELYKILGKRNEVFVLEQNCMYQDCDGKDQHSLHMWFEEEEEIVAYLRLVKPKVSYEEASIGRVLVSKDRRGEGLGRKIMKEGLLYLKELKEEKIRISAQKYLTGFYKDFGFQEVSDPYIDAQIEHVEMLLKY
jgi:ElaA protein